MTLVFLIKDNKVCLAEKKRGFRAGFLNGYGGKLEKEETPILAAKRELFEESGVTNPVLVNKGLVNFYDFDVINKVHIYTCISWVGKPIETEEMNPFWFDFKEIPLNEMGQADKIWLPYLLDSYLINASFYFDKDNLLYKIQCDFKK